jgi:hypothetical protein
MPDHSVIWRDLVETDMRAFVVVSLLTSLVLAGAPASALGDLSVRCADPSVCPPACVKEDRLTFECEDPCEPYDHGFGGTLICYGEGAETHCRESLGGGVPCMCRDILGVPFCLPS